MIDTKGDCPTPLRIDGGKHGSGTESPSARYWMRGVSFATLHRALCDFAGAGTPMRARDINAFVGGDLERVRGLKLGATTLYRYRSTLHRLRLMRKEGRLWRVDVGDQIVSTLVATCPSKGEWLATEARVPFAEAIVRHRDCRALLLDLFMPEAKSPVNFETFCAQSKPVAWRHSRRGNHARLEMWNRQTGQRWTYEHKQAVLAVLYGLRYWLRDELGVVDEYAELGENTVTLFAVYPTPEEEQAQESQVLEAARFVLSARNDSEWTTLQVADLDTPLLRRTKAGAAGAIRRPRLAVSAPSKFDRTCADAGCGRNDVGGARDAGAS